MATLDTADAVRHPNIEEARWRIDPARSRVAFRARTYWGLMTVNGEFERYTGTLDLELSALVRRVGDERVRTFGGDALAVYAADSSQTPISSSCCASRSRRSSNSRRNPRPLNRTLRSLTRHGVREHKQLGQLTDRQRSIMATDSPDPASCQRCATSVSDAVPASRSPELSGHVALGAFVFRGGEDLVRRAALDHLSVEHEDR